jgi:hypothetical protein
MNKMCKNLSTKLQRLADEHGIDFKSDMSVPEFVAWAKYVLKKQEVIERCSMD